MDPFTNPNASPESETVVLMDTPWNVVVHNDPVNLMNYVTMVFQRVLGMDKRQANKHMLEVHNQGRSVVWTGGREEAENYVMQLQKWRLTVSLEPFNQE